MNILLRCPNGGCNNQFTLAWRETIDDTVACPSCRHVFTFWNWVTAKCQHLLPGGCGRELRIPIRSAPFAIYCSACDSTGITDFGRGPQVCFDPLVLRFPNPDRPNQTLDIDDVWQGCSLDAFSSKEQEARHASRILTQARPGTKVMMCRYVEGPEGIIPRFLYGQCNFKYQWLSSRNFKCLGTLASWIRSGWADLAVRRYGVDQVWVNEPELVDSFARVEALSSLSKKCMLLDDSWNYRGQP